MELTPIKIRLKKRRAGDKGSHQPSGSHQTQKALDRERHRKKRRRKHKTGESHAAVRASYFEREVPLEVLESIFWQSENVNLPLSSLRFGWLLSGRPTLRQTFINAFAPTWDIWHGCVQQISAEGRRIFSSAGQEEVPEQWGGNPDFQSALLRQPWSDIDMILESEQFWCNRSARDRVYEPAKLWGDVQSQTLEEDDPQVSSLVRDEFLNDYAAFRQTEKLALPLDGSLVNTSKTYIRAHQDTQIPEELITGPWADAKSIQKLFWLVRAGCRLTEDQTWEVTLEGFQNAVWGSAKYEPGWKKPSSGQEAPPEHKVDLTVVRLLVALDAFRQWPPHVVRDELDKLLQRLEDSKKYSPVNVYAYTHAALEVRRHYPDEEGEYAGKLPS